MDSENYLFFIKIQTFNPLINKRQKGIKLKFHQYKFEFAVANSGLINNSNNL